MWMAKHIYILDSLPTSFLLVRNHIPSHSDPNVTPRPAPRPRRAHGHHRGHARWRSRWGRPGGARRSRRTLLPAPLSPKGARGAARQHRGRRLPHPNKWTTGSGHALRPTANPHKTTPIRIPHRSHHGEGLTLKVTLNTNPTRDTTGVGNPSQPDRNQKNPSPR